MTDTRTSAEKLERVARAIFMTDYGHIGPEAWETARLDGNSERPEAFVKARAAIAALDDADRLVKPSETKSGQEFCFTEAQVEATLALVEQQRISNLIALGSAEHGPYRYLDAGRTGLMSMDAYGAAAVLLGIELKEESK